MSREDEAYRYAQECIWNGLSPDEALQYLREAWMIVLDAEKRKAERQFANADRCGSSSGAKEENK